MNHVSLDLTADHVTVNINVFPSVLPTSGDTVKVRCQVNVPERFVDEPSTFGLAYNLTGTQLVGNQSGNVFIANLTRDDGDTFSKNVTFDPIRTSDARGYYCIVTFQELGVTVYSFHNLTVYSK